MKLESSHKSQKLEAPKDCRTMAALCGLLQIVSNNLLQTNSRRLRGEIKNEPYVDHLELLRWKILNAVVVVDLDPKRTVRAAFAEHMLRFQMHMVDLEDVRWSG